MLVRRRHPAGDLEVRPAAEDDERVAGLRDLLQGLARVDLVELLEAQGLVIGRGRPGSYLGYDRDGKQGPWLLNRLVRWIHRHSGYVPMSDVVSVDWDGHRVVVTGPLQPLDHS